MLDVIARRALSIIGVLAFELLSALFAGAGVEDGLPPVLHVVRRRGFLADVSDVVVLFVVHLGGVARIAKVLDGVFR